MPLKALYPKEESRLVGHTNFFYWQEKKEKKSHSILSHLLEILIKFKSLLLSNCKELKYYCALLQNFISIQIKILHTIKIKKKIHLYIFDQYLY